MRVPFRQGIVKHPTSGFLNYEVGNKSWSLLVATRNVTLTLAHRGVDYLFIEQNPITSAWDGPVGGFNAGTKYWLYWDFSLLDFTRTFGYTDIEPVIQTSEPGNSDTDIVAITESSSPATASFTVEGKYVPVLGRQLVVYGSVGSPNIDGVYTVIGSEYDIVLAQTTIFVQEPILNDTVTGSPPSGGTVSFDLDSDGNPMKTEGRMWYQPGHGLEINWVYQSGQWVETIRVFAAMVIGINAYGMSSENINVFTGTQIGDSSEVNSGRPIFTDVGIPVKMSDGIRFFTTESNFYASAVAANNVRLESNLHLAQAGVASVGAYNIVSYDTSDSGKVKTAEYADIGNTVIGIALEGFLLGETGTVLLQGVVINAGWDWSNDIGKPLWTDDIGNLTAIDPHVADPITHTVGQVPIARVLEPDTIIFEQGLGGKGDKGERGLAGSVSPATVTELGVVTISVPPLDPEMPCAIGCNDPILTSPKVPQPHTHEATEITVDAIGTCFPTSTNVQEALVQICDEFNNIEATEITVDAIGTCFPSSANVQEALVQICNEIDSIRPGSPLPSNLPDGLSYDIAIFNPGPVTAAFQIIGAFLIPRDMDIIATEAHIAAAIGGSVDMNVAIERFDTPYVGSPIEIGEVDFFQAMGSPTTMLPGLVTIPSDISLSAGDIIQIRARGTFDILTTQMSITLIGCAPPVDCS